MINNSKASNQTLYAAQEQFIKLLNNATQDKETLGREVVLCGGTALARCYLDHRISYDLDFFVDGTFDPELLAIKLGKQGIHLNDVQIENSGQFVHQLFGFTNIDGVQLKVSFIEDSYAGMFPRAAIPFGDTEFNIECVEGLYHRKLRTVSGSGYGDRPLDGRQTARDLFDLYMLDLAVKPMPEFIAEINQAGANFPEKAFMSGLASMPWIAMMDDFEQLDFNAMNPHLINLQPENIMAMVRARTQEVFKEMAHYGKTI